MSRIYVDRISPYQSGSLSIDGFSPTVDTGSLLPTASFNDYTSSNDARVNSIELETASLDSKVNSLINETGSYATTGANTFTDNQIMSGSITFAPNETLVIGNASSNNFQLTTFDETDTLALSGTTKSSIGIISTDWNNQTPMQQTTVVGAFSLGAQQAQSGSATMVRNTSFGYNNLRLFQTGNDNSVNGAWSLEYLASGSNNTAVGSFAGRFLPLGTDNTFIGRSALGALGFNNFADFKDNTAIGARSGLDTVDGAFLTGSQSSTFLGAYIKSNSITSSYEIVIGADAEGHGDNTTTLGSINQTQETYLIGDTIISGSNGTSGNLTAQGTVYDNLDFSVGGLQTKINYTNVVGRNGETFSDTFFGTSDINNPGIDGLISLYNAGSYFSAMSHGPNNFRVAIRPSGSADTSLLRLTDEGDLTTLLLMEATKTQVTTEMELTGSISINETLKLAPQDPLPSGELGELAVSGSNLYFNNGTSWSQIN